AGRDNVPLSEHAAASSVVASASRVRARRGAGARFAVLAARAFGDGAVVAPLLPAIGDAPAWERSWRNPPGVARHHWLPAAAAQASPGSASAPDPSLA